MSDDRQLREEIAARLESEIRPLLSADALHEDGYNCCGCSTYAAILDHAIRIVLDDGSDKERRSERTST